MPNGLAALGILSGGSTGGTPSISGLSLFKQINRNEGKLRQQYFNRADVQKNIETFKNKISKFEDVDALVKDRKSLQFLLAAFDLDSEINNAGKIKTILKSDVTDPNSFANRLNDKRFGELAKFVNASEKGLSNLQTASSQQTLIDKFLQNTFEKDVGGKNPEIAKALYFLRNINSVDSTASLLGTLQFRHVVTTTLRLPQEIARQSIDKQIAMVEAKFDVKKAVTTGDAKNVSDIRQTRFTDDIQAMELAEAQVTRSESALKLLNKKLKVIREQLDGVPSITDPTGINSTRIPIHKTAVKQLSEIKGSNSAAEAALNELDPVLTYLDNEAVKIRDVTTQDDLDAFKATFAAEASKVADLIYHTARFRDPDTGNNINLFKPGGGTVDAGQPNTYDADRINYAYQGGALGANPITTLSGTLGSNPFTVQTGTLGSNPFQSIGGFPDGEVRVTHPSHPFEVGDQVTISGASDVVGMDVNGTFTITAATSNTYEFDCGVDQTASGSGGGDSVVVSASNQILVSHTGHPFDNGDTVTFSNGDTVGGLDLDGSFTVANKTDNTYTITASAQAAAGTTGGGSTVGVNASNQVQVAHTGHEHEAGGYVTLSNVSSVGGLTLNGTFQIASTSTNSYVITVGSQAIAGQTGGGSSVGYGHTLGSNPFTTTNGSPLVSVAHDDHGLEEGDVVLFSNSSSVGGLDLDTTFRVTSVTDADNYVVTAVSNATSDANGGGSAVGYELPYLISVVDEINSNVIAHHKHMATFVSKLTSAASTIASATLSNAHDNANSAMADLTDAKKEFADASTVVLANNATFSAETGKVYFAARLNSTELAKGRESVLDAISRTKLIEDSLKSIDALATKSFTSDNATQYASIRADIVNLLNTPGTVTGSTSGTLGSNPFQTQGGNAQVTVTQANHGFTAGDSVTFSGGNAVGGLDLNATFVITSITDDDTYVVTASSNATSGATGGGGSISFSGAPIQTLDNLLSVSTNTNYRIRTGVNQYLAANPGLNDIDGSGPYSLNNGTRLATLLPSSLTSGNQATVQTNSVTLLKNTETVRKQLERDQPVFDFVGNIADPLGAVDAQMRDLRENIDDYFKAGSKTGALLIEPSAQDLIIRLGSVGKKLTVEAQNTLKDTLKTHLDNYVYSVLKGGRSGSLGSNPYTTTKDSSTVTVAHSAHGFDVNDFVEFNNGSDVGGLNLDTTFQISSVLDANRYTITASSNATSSATGGGGLVTFTTIPSDRNTFMVNSHFDANRAYGKMRTERYALDIEATILRSQFNQPIETQTQFLEPLKNTDYAIKFIEKYLLIKDLETTGVSFSPTNNNALAVNLIKSINPNTGVGLSVNLFS